MPRKHGRRRARQINLHAAIEKDRRTRAIERRRARRKPQPPRPNRRTP